MNHTAVESYLPFWNKITEKEKEMLRTAEKRNYPKGTVISYGEENCIGLLIVISGRLRVSTVAEEGREISLLRLLERDICLFSATCIFRSIQSDLIVTAEEDTQVWHIPVSAYKKVMEQSAVVANYTTELMASYFSDMVWLMDQVINKKLDSRLAAFLLEESELEGKEQIEMTQEQIAHYLGSAREVVSRMLKYFQQEGMIRSERGCIRLLKPERLRETARESLR